MASLSGKNCIHDHILTYQFKITWYNYKENYLLCLFFAFFFLLITLNAFNYEFLLRFLLGFLVILIITNLVTKKGLDYF